MVTDQGDNFTVPTGNFLRDNSLLIEAGGTATTSQGNIFAQTTSDTTIDINGGIFNVEAGAGGNNGVVFLGNGGAVHTFTITGGEANFDVDLGIARDEATSLLDIQGGVVDITGNLDFFNGSTGNSGVNGLIDLSGGELIVGGDIIDVTGATSSFEDLFNDGFLLSGGQGVADGAFTDFFAVDASGNLAVVPEPSSAALLGLGGLALIMRRRK